jgi:hypothetical protein
VVSPRGAGARLESECPGSHDLRTTPRKGREGANKLQTDPAAARLGYLHYVFDLWVEVWRKKVASGDVIVVRYADDLVMGFQHRNGCRAVPERAPGTAGEVRLETASGQNTADRVRAVRRSQPETARRGKTRPSRSWGLLTTVGNASKTGPSSSGGSRRRSDGREAESHQG